MNLTITAQIGAKSTQNKGLEILNSKHLKTRTDLSIAIGKEDVPNFLDAVEDISLLQLEGAPVSTVSIMAVDVKSLGKLVNRSRNSMLKAGIQLGDAPLDWKDTAGTLIVKGTKSTPLYGADIPFLFEFLYRMLRRANTVMSGTEHPLTLFDLKQATGIIYGLKSEDDDAMALDQWLAPRELICLEEAKAKMKAKAGTKAKMKATMKAKAKAEVTEDPEMTEDQETSPVKANLGNLS